MRKLKLVFFDLDNVLFDVGYLETYGLVSPSTWGVIDRTLNVEQEENKLKERWSKSKNYSYVDWANDSVTVYKKHGLNRQRFSQVIEGLPVMPGAKQTISTLKKKGYKTAIISGSFQELGLRAKKSFGIDFVIAACSLLFDKKGNINDWTLLPCDYHGKANFAKALAASLGIKIDECAFVCDGINDIYLAEKVGLSIAFNAANDTVRKHCDVSIEEKDLRKILKYL